MAHTIEKKTQYSTEFKREVVSQQRRGGGRGIIKDEFEKQPFIICVSTGSHHSIDYVEYKYIRFLKRPYCVLILFFINFMVCALNILSCNVIINEQIYLQLLIVYQVYFQKILKIHCKCIIF